MLVASIFSADGAPTSSRFYGFTLLDSSNRVGKFLLAFRVPNDERVVNIEAAIRDDGRSAMPRLHAAGRQVREKEEPFHDCMREPPPDQSQYRLSDIAG